MGLDLTCLWEIEMLGKEETDEEVKQIRERLSKP